MQLIFASSNKNKIAEVQSILPTEFSLIGLEEIGITGEIPEAGITLKENACLKATFVTEFIKERQMNAPVFADDSGLEVETLGGAPGVYSARFAGTPKNDENNNKKLLKELKSATNRKARFVTVICLIIEGKAFYFEGVISGSIAPEERGSNGFGYDPLFVPGGYKSSFAELGPQIKNRLSHRAIAVQKLADFLTKK